MSQVSLDRSVSPSGDSHPRWQCGAQWHPVFEQARPGVNRGTSRLGRRSGIIPSPGAGGPTCQSHGETALTKGTDNITPQSRAVHCLKMCSDREKTDSGRQYTNDALPCPGRTARVA